MKKMYLVFAALVIASTGAFSQTAPTTAQSVRCGKPFLQLALESEYKVWATAVAAPALTASGGVVVLHMIEDPNLHEWGIIAKGTQECDLVQGNGMTPATATTEKVTPQAASTPKSREVGGSLVNLSKFFAEQYGESPIRVGQRGAGGLGVNKINWFVNAQTGTWSIVESTPNGYGSLMAWGTDFQLK